MDNLSADDAAAMLEDYARGLHGESSLKWTGEFGALGTTETRLLGIASALRQSEPPGRLTEDDAQFVRDQAESLRSPNRLTLDDPMISAEWRLAAESTFRMAEQLDAVAAIISARSG